MIFVLLGTPSPFTYIVSNLLRAIVQTAFGDHHMIGVNDADALNDAWPDADQRKGAVVIASDMPQAELIAFLVEVRAPIVLATERVDEICEYFITCRETPPVQAMRVATQSLSNLGPLAVAAPPSVLRVRPIASRSLGEVVAALAAFFRLEDRCPVPTALRYLGLEDKADLTFADFVKQNRYALLPDLERDLRLDEKQYAAYEQIARGYNPLALGQPATEVFWPALCFVRVDGEGGADEELSLEGRARYLFTGPYLHLPAGLWSVEMAFEVRECFSKNRLGFDVNAATVLAARIAELPDEGFLACDMVFRIASPATPVEIRVQLLTGAIEGKLRLHGATLRRLPEAEA